MHTTRKQAPSPARGGRVWSNSHSRLVLHSQQFRITVVLMPNWNSWTSQERQTAICEFDQILPLHAVKGLACETIVVIACYSPELGKGLRCLKIFRLRGLHIIATSPCIQLGIQIICYALTVSRYRGLQNLCNRTCSSLVYDKAVKAIVLDNALSSEVCCKDSANPCSW